MPDFAYQPIAVLSKKLASGEISSKDITLRLLDRIEKLDSEINAFIRLEKESAVRDAEEADRKIASGESGALLGVPIAVKDLIAVENGVTTCGSRMLENFVSPYSATVVKKLRKAGAVVLGKTNMDEFAMGSSNETSRFGPCRNPWNTENVPGGSSGGSAAAVAAGFCPAALGSDTGGSIRQPASFCGIVGLKPTYGRVSRFGLVAFASSLDQIGPMGLTVEDTAILLQATAGHDPMDSTSVNIPVPDYSASLNEGVDGMVVGLPKEYYVEGMDKEVRSIVLDAAAALEKAGAKIEEISLPHTEYAVSVYYVIAPAEASSNLSRYDGVKYGYRSDNAATLGEMYENTRTEGFGAEVQRRIMLGTYVLSAGYYDAYYLKAQKVRTLIINDFKDAFKKCDVLLTPAAPTPAFKLGEKTDNPLKMYLNDIFTINVNLAGVPAISVPAGFSSTGLPVGVQMIADNFKEPTLFRAASAFEKMRDPEISQKHPAL